MNDTALIEAAKKRVQSVYRQPHGGSGGGLHIVVDDYNVGDDHIEWCMRNADLTDIEWDCAIALLRLSEDEREIICRAAIP